MKIVQIIPNLEDGGAERFVFDLCNELVKNDKLEIILLTFFSVDKNNFYLNNLDSGVSHISLNKKLGFDSSLIYRLRKTIKEIKPDIIHTHLRSAMFYLSVSINLGLGKYSIVHTVHNDAFREVSGKWDLRFRNLIYRTFSNIKLVTISLESQNSFTKAYPGLENQLIYNGRLAPAETSKLKETQDFFGRIKSEFGDDVRVVVNIGRIVPQKKQLMLSEIVSELSQEGYNICLLVLGSERKGFSEPLIQQINELNCSRVKLLGNVSNPTDFLYLSNLFILGSEYEGMPISLIEAIACGLVPVCTPVGGIKEMVLSNGFVSNSTLKSDLKKSLIQAVGMTKMENKQKTENLIQDFKDRFDIEICASNYLEFYKKIDLNK